jgi:hypothetical protein
VETVVANKQGLETGSIWQRLTTHRVLRICFLVGIICVALVVSGCAQFKTYMESRGNDLADCFTVRAGKGYGLAVRTQVTDYVRASAGISVHRDNWIGYLGREPVDAPTDQIWVGLPFSALVLSTEMRLGPTLYDLFPSLLGFNVAEFWRNPDSHYPRPDWSPQAPLIREKFFIEVGATLGAIGFDVGFNPVELVDFLLGLFGIDITRDDTEITDLSSFDRVEKTTQDGKVVEDGPK